MITLCGCSNNNILVLYGGALCISLATYGFQKGLHHQLVGIAHWVIPLCAVHLVSTEVCHSGLSCFIVWAPSYYRLVGDNFFYCYVCN